MSKVVVSAVLALASGNVAFGAEAGADLVPRDAAAKMYTSAYSTKAACSERMLGALHITFEACAERVEKAKQECFVAITQGLPTQLNEKQLFMLVGRSPWCLMRKVTGKEYRNSDYDPPNEKLWAEHSHG